MLQLIEWLASLDSNDSAYQTAMIATSCVVLAAFALTIHTFTKGKLVRIIPCLALFAAGLLAVQMATTAQTITTLRSVQAFEKANTILAKAEAWQLQDVTDLTQEYAQHNWLKDADRLSLLTASTIIKDPVLKAEILQIAKAPASIKEDKEEIIKKIVALPIEQIATDNQGALSIIASLK